MSRLATSPKSHTPVSCVVLSSTGDSSISGRTSNSAHSSSCSERSPPLPDMTERRGAAQTGNRPRTGTIGLRKELAYVSNPSAAGSGVVLAENRSRVLTRIPGAGGNGDESRIVEHDETKCLQLGTKGKNARAGEKRARDMMRATLALILPAKPARRWGVRLPLMPGSV